MLSARSCATGNMKRRCLTRSCTIHPLPSGLSSGPATAVKPQPLSPTCKARRTSFISTVGGSTPALRQPSLRYECLLNQRSFLPPWWMRIEGGPQSASFECTCTIAFRYRATSTIFYATDNAYPIAPCPQVLLKHLIVNVPGRVQKDVLKRLASLPAFAATTKLLAASLKINRENQFSLQHHSRFCCGSVTTWQLERSLRCS